MKMHIAKFSMLALCAAAILAVPASSSAQVTTNTPAPPVKQHAAAPSATLAFHGVLTAVDTNAMTLTVEKRTFNMTSETIVTRNDKPAVLAEGTVGDLVSGTYKKNAEGKLDAVMLRFSDSTGHKATR